MPKINEINYFHESFVDTPNLRSWFGKVERGNSQVYDTPFAKGESTAQMLAAWNNLLESVSQRWPSLYQFEIDLASKVGPLSVQLPIAERMHDIDSYYEGILLPSEPISDSAVKAVVKEFNPTRGLTPRNQRGTVTGMKLSTNSGSPFFAKRRAVLSHTVPCRVHSYRQGVVQQLQRGNWNAAAVIGWRGQEGGPSISDVKQRLVWMFPFAVNVCELQVYQPFIEAAQRFNVIPAWVSMESVDTQITKLFDSKTPSDLVVCTDFSKFDQHFNAHMQESALNILTAILSPGMTSSDWLRTVFPIKYNIPLAYGWEKIRFGSHGMASGSGGTNVDETLAHRALQFETAQSKGVRLNPFSQCLGDDGILSYPGITVEDVLNVYRSHGLEMNADKQYASTQDCVYLRRWHHKDYRIDGICAGVYSTMRALGRLRYLERFMDPKYWDEKAVALRQLSIIENCKFHPLREEFAEFCMKRDKYRLGIDIPNFLSHIRRVAREKIDFMPDLLGYTKTLQGQGDPLGGIENWWIVKYLRSRSK